MLVGEQPPQGSFDSYLWQTVENKQKFISQIMTSKSPVRSCEDVDETALSYAEIKALCAGDDRIKEKMALDVDVARLRLMKSEHQSNQYRLEDKLLKQFPHDIEQSRGFLLGLQKDQDTLAAHPLPEKDFVGVTILGKDYSDKEKAGEAILEACKSAKMDKEFGIGQYRGFLMYLTYNPLGNQFILSLKGEMTHPVELGPNAVGNFTRIENALAAIPKRMAALEDKLESLNQQMATARAELGKPFPQEAELKPEALIERIISIGSNPGDLVLDSFLGSGTTAAVAHKMGRRYIGIEMGDHAYTHCKVRLDKVISGEDKGGITKSAGWISGGGYHFYELAPSLINEDPFGEPVINPDYNADMLAAAMALHEGFSYQPDHQLFWKQSTGNENSFLFVTTRHLNSPFLDSIRDTMEEGEYLIIACRSFDAGLEKAYSNITIKKIPQMLLDRCEFGKTDYNLNIVRPPVYDDEEVDFDE